MPRNYNKRTRTESYNNDATNASNSASYDGTFTFPFKSVKNPIDNPEVSSITASICF